MIPWREKEQGRGERADEEEEENGVKIRKGGKIFNYKTKLIWYDQRLSCMVTELHYAVI